MVAESDLARKGERDPRCPRCGARLQLDGSKHDGARSHECPICGAKATNDGLPSHNQMIKENRLTDDWRKFVTGDKGYESAMKRMSNCCSYLRHAFESHNGIKHTKLEAYGSWFLYRWMHRRKYGLEASVKFLISRIFGAPKSHKFDDYCGKDEIWSR